MSWPRDNADDEWTYEGEADTDRVAEEAAEPPVPPDRQTLPYKISHYGVTGSMR
jgi:hypothetical protein